MVVGDFWISIFARDFFVAECKVFAAPLGDRLAFGGVESLCGGHAFEGYRRTNPEAAFM
jgi:hypothetical protein